MRKEVIRETQAKKTRTAGQPAETRSRPGGGSGKTRTAPVRRKREIRVSHDHCVTSSQASRTCLAGAVEAGEADEGVGEGLRALLALSEHCVAAAAAQHDKAEW